MIEERRVTINRFRGPRRGATLKDIIGPLVFLHIDGTGVEARYPFRLTDGLGDDPKMGAWRIDIDDLEELRELARSLGSKFRERVGDLRYRAPTQRKKKQKPQDPRQGGLF